MKWLGNGGRSSDRLLPLLSPTAFVGTIKVFGVELDHDGAVDGASAKHAKGGRVACLLPCPVAAGERVAHEHGVKRIRDYNVQYNNVLEYNIQ